jgi:hypothetical protein
MNLRTAEIQKWCKAHRPDLMQYVQENTPDAFALLLSIGFEAGRQFQSKNPKLALDNPNVYLN